MSNVGLFTMLGSDGVIRNVGLIDINVDSAYPQVDDANVGTLVGRNYGSITASYATGAARGNYLVGGLVGENSGSITASYAGVAVDGSSGATTDAAAGGLAGRNTKYGYDTGTITASYAWGKVIGSATGVSGGLVGRNDSPGAVTDNYWDTETSGQNSSAVGVGKTTAELQSPTGYTGIYTDWNLDLDGDGTGDDPWWFPSPPHYPALSWQTGSSL